MEINMDYIGSITALMSSFGRAYHAKNSKNPVFADTAAEKLLSEQEYEFIKNHILQGIEFFEPDKKDTFKDETEALNYIINTHISPSPLCRAEYAETALKTAVKTGTEQYVILGAGFDTFALRNPEFMRSHKVFEVDEPKTQLQKQIRLQNAGIEPPENLVFVPADLGKRGLGKKLENAGFDKSRKTFFSWLGVSYYLDIAEIGKMLDTLGKISADGSSVVFDFADEGLFEASNRRVQNMLSLALAGGEPMKTCFSYADLEKLLEKHNFLIYEMLTPKDIQEQIINKKGADMKAFEHINYALAVYKK